MTGKLFIDLQDIYTNYGIFVVEQGHNDLICYPALKEVNYNDWPDEDGIEADLTSPVLDTREFNLKMALHGTGARIDSFIQMLSNSAYHTWLFQEIGRSYKLRLVGQPDLTTLNTIGMFSLTLADDYPLKDYTYQAPVSSIVPETGYQLDGTDFSEYGIMVLQGSKDEVMISAPAKRNLLVNIKSVSGAVYDGQAVKFKAKDVRLRCLMRAETLQELWRNYDAFLYDLVRPGERLLYVDDTGYEYRCFYRRADVSEFYATGKIWLRFDITLTFTSFRLEGEEYVLAAESSYMIITEQDNYAIDLSTNGN